MHYELCGATITIERDGVTADGRDRFEWTITFEGSSGETYSGNDLYSGVGGCSEERAMGSLFSFLRAAGESYGFRQRTGHEGEHEDLFPSEVTRWAAMNYDSIAMAGEELDAS